jgi:hypothetical protein
MRTNILELVDNRGESARAMRTGEVCSVLKARARVQLTP